MSPVVGRIRGTSPDLYSKVPSSKAFKAAMTLGPTRNVAMWLAALWSSSSKVTTSRLLWVVAHWA